MDNTINNIKLPTKEDITPIKVECPVFDLISPVQNRVIITPDGREISIFDFAKEQQ